MDQNDRRRYLIERLLAERPDGREFRTLGDEQEQRSLLRALMNVRMPDPIDEVFLVVQDEYLREVNAQKGIVELSELKEVRPDIYLWRGDITRLKVGAIVNAANSGMTGCYIPNHACIDNCIHTYAGIQLRLACAEMMAHQGYEEPTGRAKITPAYNLPCDYVLHTVGPIVNGDLKKEHEDMLASCYRSCLALAEENCISSVAFCCISTGVFKFPARRAAEIAVQSVQEFKKKTGSQMKIIFNVFKESDESIYEEQLR